MRNWITGTADPDRGLAAVMSIPGQITREEARTLMDLARQTPLNTAIVEIGTFRGRSSVALALGSRRGHGNRVYAIDPHVEFVGVLGGRFGPEDMAHFYRNVTKAGVGSLVAAICLPSLAASRAWTGAVGMLWIDGDHRREAVNADLQAWSPFVVAKGIIAFHDADAEGVRDVIAFARRDGTLQPAGRVGALAWFVKTSHA